MIKGYTWMCDLENLRWHEQDTNPSQEGPRPAQLAGAEVRRCELPHLGWQSAVRVAARGSGLCLDCYWVGSLDFNFVGNEVQQVKLFAGGSTATKMLRPEIAESGASSCVL